MSATLAERLVSPDADTRRQACRDASGDATGPLQLEALVACAADPVAAVARAASDALAAIARSGESNAAAVDAALHGALRGDDPDRRFGAARVSARFAPPGPGLLPVLVEALSRPEGSLRWEAARLLVDAGRLHPEVLRLLLGLVHHGAAPAARRMASFCLRELAPDLPEAAEALLAASREDDTALRRAALTALSALPDPPSAVRERLEEARSDPDPGTRRVAELGLAQIEN